MSDALTAKLDEIERRWSRRRMIHDKGTRSHGQPCKCSECREARIGLALVAAVRATEVHRELWNTSPMVLQ